MALTLRESYGLGLFSQEGCTAEEIKKKTKKNVKHYKLNNKSFFAPLSQSHNVYFWNDFNLLDVVELGYNVVLTMLNEHFSFEHLTHQCSLVDGECNGNTMYTRTGKKVFIQPGIELTHSPLHFTNVIKRRNSLLWTDLLVSVAFPYVDAGQVGYNVCPQFLVCGELKHKKTCGHNLDEKRSRCKTALKRLKWRNFFTILKTFEGKGTLTFFYINVKCFQPHICFPTL